MKRKIDIVKMKIEEKEEFRTGRFAEYWNILKQYGIDSDEYTYFDVFFDNDDYIAYWFVYNGEKVGFTMVSKTDNNGLGINQFYIFKEFEKKHFGSDCIHELLKQNPGLVSLGYLNKNAPAKAFWTKICDKYNDLVIDGKRDFRTSGSIDDLVFYLQFQTHIAENEDEAKMQIKNKSSLLSFQEGE